MFRSIALLTLFVATLAHATPVSNTTPAEESDVTHNYSSDFTDFVHDYVDELIAEVETDNTDLAETLKNNKDDFVEEMLKNLRSLGLRDITESAFSELTLVEDNSNQRPRRGIRDFDRDAFFNRIYGAYEKYDEARKQLVKVIIRTVFDVTIDMLIKAEDVYNNWRNKKPIVTDTPLVS